MSYLGSKAASGAYQAIIANMPPHDTYIETHLGSGAIMRKKPKASTSIGIDIDPSAIDNFICTAGEHVAQVAEFDALTFLKRFDFSLSGRTLVYCDPPYLWSTRSSRAKYDFEYDDEDHKDLIAQLKVISEIGVKVMISGYPSDLYNNLLTKPNWHSIEFQVMTRGGPRTEKLWMNFVPNSYHWCEFAGKNFTDRQRIKRKAERWAKKYKALPNHEKTAVLSAILGCDRK